MQTLGTWLQLIGASITLGGLLWAWHKTSGRIAQWRGAIGEEYVSLLDSIAARFTPPPPPTPKGGTIASTIPKPTSQMQGYVDNGTDEERLTRLETENATRADESDGCTGSDDHAALLTGPQRRQGLLPVVVATPTETVTATPTTTAAPALQGADAKFIAFLRGNGPIGFNAVSTTTAIAYAHLVCQDLQQGAGFQDLNDKMQDLSPNDITWFVNAVPGFYCPQFNNY